MKLFPFQESQSPNQGFFTWAPSQLFFHRMTRNPSYWARLFFCLVVGHCHICVFVPSANFFCQPQSGKYAKFLAVANSAIAPCNYWKRLLGASFEIMEQTLFSSQAFDREAIHYRNSPILSKEFSRILINMMFEDWSHEWPSFSSRTFDADKTSRTILVVALFRCRHRSP